MLHDMIDHARRAVVAAQGRRRRDLDRDDVLAAARERFIEVVGEAAGKVSGETRATIHGVPWQKIVGMRNRLVHGYVSLDHDIIWNVVKHDLPPLVRALERAIESG